MLQQIPSPSRPHMIQTIFHAIDDVIPKTQNSDFNKLPRFKIDLIVQLRRDPPLGFAKERSLLYNLYSVSWLLLELTMHKTKPYQN